MELFEETSDTANHPYVRRLGEGACDAEGTTIGQLDLLARAGLPVLAGMVITREAHWAFLQSSGRLVEIFADADEQTHDRILKRRRWHARTGHACGGHTPSLVDGELNRAICEALMELGAPSVAVISEGVRIGDLKSIPEVKDAIRKAWLHERGLERQIAAARAKQEIPTWPVLIQREIKPIYTGWSTTGEAVLSAEVCSGKRTGEKVGLYDVEPAGEADAQSRSISCLTLEAASVLGNAIRIDWGLESSKWYVRSIVTKDNQDHRKVI
jgi:hypothetical protein